MKQESYKCLKYGLVVQKILLKTENYTFIEPYFRTFWFMGQKYGKFLPEK